MSLKDNRTSVTATGSDIYVTFDTDKPYNRDKSAISFHFDWSGVTGSGTVELLEGNITDTSKALASTDDSDTAITFTLSGATGNEKINSYVADATKYYFIKIPSGVTAGTILIYTNVTGLTGS